MSKREQILGLLAIILAEQLPAQVHRNAVLPEKVPAAGLVILRDGEPGEPDITLNPRTEFYAHRAELEVYVPRAADGSGEAALDRLLGQIGSALRVDETLGGRAENLFVSAPDTGALALEGAPPVLTARIIVTIEYLVSDPLSD